MEKFNNSKYCDRISLDICIEKYQLNYMKYYILIHSSKETLINDLETEPIVTMGIQQGKLAKITKSNLNAIATDANPCTNDDKLLVRAECELKKVFA